MPTDAHPPAGPAHAREFPFAAGTGAVSVAFAAHRRAPVTGDHIDLFIGSAATPPPDPDARVARTFRLATSAFAAGAPSPGIVDAVELEPHRAEYLSLERPRELSDGRGNVEPLRRETGVAAVHDDRLELHCGAWSAFAERVDSARWRFTFRLVEGGRSTCPSTSNR